MKLNRFIWIALLSVFCFSGSRALASHIVGADLFYSCVSGNTYKISLVLYGDCGPDGIDFFAKLPVGAPQICVLRDTVYDSTITLHVQAPDTGIAVNALCGRGWSGSCGYYNPNFPTTKKFTYEGVYTLPTTDAHWRFVFNGDLGPLVGMVERVHTFTNLAHSGGILHLEAMLDNTLGPNSNPTMSDITGRFYTINSNHNYVPAGTDPDSDSLIYVLTSPTEAGSGTKCMAYGAEAYASGFSPTYPMAASTFIFDSTTGVLTFLPTAIQRIDLVYSIQEYRSGVLVGTHQREMGFSTITSMTGNTEPFGGFDYTTTGRISDATHLRVCATTGSFTATIHPTESDTAQKIKVTAIGLPPGATFNVTGDSTNHPVCFFMWAGTAATYGTYTFYINYRDSACPVAGNNTVPYQITIDGGDSRCADAVEEVARNQSRFEVFPNPTNDGIFTVYLPGKSGIALLSMKDMTGRLVLSKVITVGDATRIDARDLLPGLYFVRVSSDHGSDVRQLLKL